MHPILYGIYYDDEDGEEEDYVSLPPIPSKPVAPVKKYGAYCRGKGCGQYNEWAEQDPDGFYLCFVCREHHGMI